MWAYESVQVIHNIFFLFFLSFENVTLINTLACETFAEKFKGLVNVLWIKCTESYWADIEQKSTKFFQFL